MKLNGIADSVILIGDVAFVFDWKFGRGFVVPAGGVNDSACNLQMLCYALGVLQKIKKAKKAIVHLVSPRRDEVSRAEYTRADMGAMRDRINAVIARGLDPDAEPMVNDACKYCDQLTTCPAHYQTALAIAGTNGLTIPASANPETMTAEVIDEGAYQVAVMMEQWARAVKKKAKSFSDDGHQFKTLKVRERSNPARFKDNADALRQLLTVSDIDLVAAGITFHPKKLMAAVEATGDESLIKDFEVLLGTLMEPASKTAYLAAVKARTHQHK
ncbi:MAG: hypothetical protein CL569_05025 [Alphaproteobacteria bacterium]|nr:hypothetical protein [Alphaproteobacteria bacterium]